MIKPAMREFLAPVSYDKGNELPCSEWGQLEQGHSVIVQRDDGPLLGGEVDVRTYDASVLWIWLDGGAGRIAVYADQGTRVWVPKA
jgi:hypothetical protein